MGEATSDYLNAALGPAIAVADHADRPRRRAAAAVPRRAYVAWTYWLVVVDGRGLRHVGRRRPARRAGHPLPRLDAFYAVVLALVFVAWYRSEGTLSIHSIYTRRRERFYWATVFATFALGTAAAT